MRLRLRPKHQCSLQIFCRKNLPLGMCLWVCVCIQPGGPNPSRRNTGFVQTRLLMYRYVVSFHSVPCAGLGCRCFFPAKGDNVELPPTFWPVRGRSTRRSSIYSRLPSTQGISSTITPCKIRPTFFIQVASLFHKEWSKLAQSMLVAVSLDLGLRE